MLIEVHIYTIDSSFIMYGGKLFVVVLQELQCFPNCVHVVSSGLQVPYHFAKFRCSSFLKAKCTLFIVDLQELHVHCVLHCNY